MPRIIEYGVHNLRILRNFLFTGTPLLFRDILSLGDSREAAAQRSDVAVLMKFVFVHRVRSEIPWAVTLIKTGAGPGLRKWRDLRHHLRL